MNWPCAGLWCTRLSRSSSNGLIRFVRCLRRTQLNRCSKVSTPCRTLRWNSGRSKHRTSSASTTRLISQLSRQFFGIYVGLYRLKIKGKGLEEDKRGTPYTIWIVCVHHGSSSVRQRTECSGVAYAVNDGTSPQRSVWDIVVIESYRTRASRCRRKHRAMHSCLWPCYRVTSITVYAVYARDK